MKTYTVRAYRSQETVNDGCDYDSQYEKLSDAKKAARYSVTEDFAKSGEMSEPFGYADVKDQDGNCLFDCFAK